ncbi:MAG: NAD(P)H-dependent oxidoreductase [Leptolyngbyaceae cyanobacterium bins.59]|nr:NAD(P)H-dependent oxidoreductase [Leptolyngbyaceae cyanobacterium bins.59]
MVKIVGIGGSLRAGSYSQRALETALERIHALGAEVELIDLRLLNLPFCDGGDAYPAYPDVAKLQETVKTADGIILATPEYHGSISGVLKNALDLMGFEEFSDKVTGAISVLGGQSNSNALNDLRTVMRWVHAWMIPEQVAIGQAWKAFNEEGDLIDDALSQRLDDFEKIMVEKNRKIRGSTERAAVTA